MRRLAFSLALPILLAQSPVLASSGGGEGGGTGGLIPMDMITVPIIDSDRLIGKLRFKLVLEPHDPAAATRLAGQAARLRMAAMSAGNEFARLQVTPSEPVDVEALVHILETALHGVDDGVQKVLIVEVAATR